MNKSATKEGAYTENKNVYIFIQKWDSRRQIQNSSLMQKHMNAQGAFVYIFLLSWCCIVTSYNHQLTKNLLDS